MELHIAGQLRRTALAFQRPCPACSFASSWPVPRIRPRGQGFVVQAGTVGPSHRDEPSDRRGPLWWDTGVLHLAGNQFTVFRVSGASAGLPGPTPPAQPPCGPSAEATKAAQRAGVVSRCATVDCCIAAQTAANMAHVQSVVASLMQFMYTCRMFDLDQRLNYFLASAPDATLIVDGTGSIVFAST
jgi:hypothetical protein